MNTKLYTNDDEEKDLGRSAEDIEKMDGQEDNIDGEFDTFHQDRIDI